MASISIKNKANLALPAERDRGLISYFEGPLECGTDYYEADTQYRTISECTAIADVVFNTDPASLASDAYVIDAGGASSRIGIRVATDGRIFAYFGSQVTATADNSWSSGISAGERIQIAMTFSSDNTRMRIYVNGTKVQDIGKAATGFSFYYSTMGANYAGGELFDGIVHSVRIFDQELSQEEVASYVNGTPFNYANQAELVLPMTEGREALSGELLTDGDMEAANTAAWTPSTVALSKESGARPGGSGTRVMRSVKTGGASFFSQGNITQNETYLISGWAKPTDDPTSQPGIYASGGYIWIGTTVQDWQYFEIEHTSTVPADLIRYYVLGGPSVVCLWDDVSVKRVGTSAVDGTYADPRDGATKITDRRGYAFSGNSYMAIDVSDGRLDGTGDKTFTVACRFADWNTLSGIGVQYLVDSEPNRIAALVYPDGRIEGFVDGSSGQFAASNWTPYGGPGRLAVVTVRRKSGVVSIWINGTKLREIAQTDSDMDIDTIYLGAYATSPTLYNLEGDIYYFDVTKEALKEMQIKDLHGKLQRSINEE